MKKTIHFYLVQLLPFLFFNHAKVQIAFGTAPDSTKPTGEGSGLGVSLSYDIVVTGHGRSINMYSTERDGAEFTIYLPII